MMNALVGCDADLDLPGGVEGVERNCVDMACLTPALWSMAWSIAGGPKNDEGLCLFKGGAGVICIQWSKERLRLQIGIAYYKNELGPSLAAEVEVHPNQQTIRTRITRLKRRQSRSRSTPKVVRHGLSVEH